MNPWKGDYLSVCRGLLRFALWSCLTANGLMLGVFTIVFTFRFLRHLWSWLQRGLFGSEW